MVRFGGRSLGDGRREVTGREVGGLGAEGVAEEGEGEGIATEDGLGISSDEALRGADWAVDTGGGARGKEALKFRSPVAGPKGELGGARSGVEGIDELLRLGIPHLTAPRPIGIPEGVGHSWPATTMRW